MAQSKITCGRLTASTIQNTLKATFTLTRGGTALTTGTVTLSLFATDGTTAVTGAGNPITATHAGSPDGSWEAVIPAATAIPTAKKGKAVVSVTDGTNTRTFTRELFWGEDS